MSCCHNQKFQAEGMEEQKLRGEKELEAFWGQESSVAGTRKSVGIIGL